MNLEQALREDIKSSIGQELEEVFSPQFIKHIREENEYYVKQNGRFKDKKSLLNDFWLKEKGTERMHSKDCLVGSVDKTNLIRSKLIEKISSYKEEGVLKSGLHFSNKNDKYIKERLSILNKLLEEGVIVREHKVILSKNKITIAYHYVLKKYATMETEEQIYERFMAMRLEKCLKKRGKMHRTTLLNLFNVKKERKMVGTILDRFVSEGKVKIELQDRPYTKNKFIMCEWA